MIFCLLMKKGGPRSDVPFVTSQNDSTICTFDYLRSDILSGKEIMAGCHAEFAAEKSFLKNKGCHW